MSEDRSLDAPTAATCALSIVIPCYNEEDSIAGVLKRCLEFRSSFRGHRGREVEIIIVDDGSRDRSYSLIETHGADITIIRHPHNRGYGAALKSGLSAAKGEFIGFMDGDATIDPSVFEDFYDVITRTRGDIVIGNRLNASSKMPMVRRVGNKLFAFIIGVLTRKMVQDSASGVRLFTRRIYDRLLPLPDGLNFTPVMTCKLLCMSGVRYGEIDIEYRERLGKSKLNVLKDGYVFLATITTTIFFRRPKVIFLPLGILFYVLSLVYLWGLSERFHSTNINDIIYRMIAISFFSCFGTTFICLSIVVQEIIYQVDSTIEARSSFPYNLSKKIFYDHGVEVGTALIALGFASNVPNLIEYLRFARISRHYSYLLFGGTLIQIGLILILLHVVKMIVNEILVSSRIQGGPGSSP